MTAVDRHLATVLERAAQEARGDGSATIEAHHLLLALAADPEPTTRETLASAGLDHATIRAALDREYGQSLLAAGVSVAAVDLPRSTPAPAGSPPLGASVKLALKRGFGSVDRKRELRPAHLLLGVLLAEVGTVPRALALAGTDRAALVGHVRQRLGQG
jgi:D-alanyl-D-alanine carboxypeptidase